MSLRYPSVKFDPNLSLVFLSTTDASGHVFKIFHYQISETVPVAYPMWRTVSRFHVFFWGGGGLPHGESSIRFRNRLSIFQNLEDVFLFLHVYPPVCFLFFV